MSFAATGNKSDPLSDLNLTPMIDVLLVLLVISMVSVPLLQRHLDLQIPVVRERSTSAPSQSIVLEVQADGSIAVNGQAVARDELVTWLRRLYADRPDKLLFIKASGELEYQTVIDVFAAARAAGVQVLGLVPPD